MLVKPTGEPWGVAVQGRPVLASAWISGSGSAAQRWPVSRAAASNQGSCAQVRAWALSVMPGNNRRSSMAVDSSPPWVADLWQAELRQMEVRPRSEGTDPAQQRRADRAGAAMSYAEDEALATFAETTPETTCGPLAHNPDLKRADDMVAAFRAQTS